MGLNWYWSVKFALKLLKLLQFGRSWSNVVEIRQKYSKLGQTGQNVVKDSRNLLNVVLFRTNISKLVMWCKVEATSPRQYQSTSILSQRGFLFFFKLILSLSKFVNIGRHWWNSVTFGNNWSNLVQYFTYIWIK